MPILRTRYKLSTGNSPNNPCQQVYLFQTFIKAIKNYNT